MITDDELHDILEDLVKTHEAWFGHRNGPLIKCASCQKSPYDEPPMIEMRFPEFWDRPDGTTRDGIFWLCWLCLKELFEERDTVIMNGKP